MSSFSADTFKQARAGLLDLQQQKLVLVGHINEQGRKIAELEREVQRQATAASRAQQALNDARREIEVLRTQIPDAATREAYEALVQHMSAPAESNPLLRLAA